MVICNKNRKKYPTPQSVPEGKVFLKVFGRMTISIPSTRQEEQKLGVDAGRFSMPERTNVAIKENYEARLDQCRLSPSIEQETPRSLVFFS